MSETKQPENPQAFPTLEATHTRDADYALLSHQEHHGEPGMTLRDYFAGQAMPEIMATEMRERMVRAEGQDYATRRDVRREAMTLAAEFAYEMADAMLRARGDK